MILIYCGKGRERVRRRLESRLGCVVEMPDVEPNDTLEKLRKRLRGVAVLVINMHFARKHVRLLIREARARGIAVVKLAGGYSVATILREIERQGIQFGGNVNG